MSETIDAIMDVAERRIRSAGYGGFSFRTIAAEVGVKGSSVHYHFPSKEVLAAAVARRYNDRIAESVQKKAASGMHIVQAWRDAFRNALADGARMCLCGALAATSGDLSPEVAEEVQRFFDIGMDSLTQGGLSRDRATQVLAILEGAILMASVRNDAVLFDVATAMLE